MPQGPVRAQHVADAGLTVRLAHERHEGSALQFVQFTLVKPGRGSRSAARQHKRQAPRDLRVPCAAFARRQQRLNLRQQRFIRCPPAAYTGCGCGAR